MSAPLTTAMAVAGLPLLPLWAAACASHPRLRRDLPARFGLQIPPVACGAIWIHGASVGEIGAAEALAAELGGPILITSDTDTGADRARQIGIPGVVGGIRPVDHPWIIAPIWADARPRAVIFIEGTWWPQLAQLARGSRVPVIRASARTGRRTRSIAGGWYRHWVASTDLILARDEGEAAWFRTHQDAPVEVTGDLKSSGRSRVNPLTWDRPFIVGASTRAGDEALLLDAMGDLGLVLAPRHPERFDEVAALLRIRGLRWRRRTEIAGPVDVDVVLLDTLGELSGCLVGASAAFIGGTFDPDVGGHSPLEAARVGTPVVAGPQIHANRVAFEACSALITDPGGLSSALRSARAVPIDNGAASRTAARIRQLIGDPAPESSPRPWARPLGVAFSVGARVRNTLYDRKILGAVRVEVPVISVGSANSRGSGKSSTVRWLAEVLRDLGYRPGIALRGYRRTTANPLGDEGTVLYRAGFLVAARPDRVAAARELRGQGADVILLDDGLQHRRLHRDLEVVVVDARFPTGRSSLPAGEGREDPVPARADLVVIHHGDQGFRVPRSRVPTVTVERIPGPWSRPGLVGPVAAFAGIGRPADFLETLELPVDRFRALRDHQPIDGALAADLLRWADGLPLVCTAKDAVRLSSKMEDRVWWRDVGLQGEPPLSLLASIGLT